MSVTLDKILELTEQVQNALDAGDWQRANELETERRAQLEALVAEQGVGEPNGELRGTLEALQQRNQRMIGEVHHHQRRVLRDATMIKTGQAAVRAYETAPTEM
jgi:hypothetical protein